MTPPDRPAQPAPDLDALMRHVPEAHGIHPNPEYEIVEKLRDTIAAAVKGVLNDDRH